MTERLTRGQFYKTHPKNDKIYYTNKVEMHINTDIGKMRQQRHHSISDEKQLRNCSHNKNLDNSSLEMLSMHSHKCKPRFVRY